MHAHYFGKHWEHQELFEMLSRDAYMWWVHETPRDFNTAWEKVISKAETGHPLAIEVRDKFITRYMKERLTK